MLSENPDSEAISTTTADEVEDIGNVVNINKDKLARWFTGSGFTKVQESAYIDN